MVRNRATNDEGFVPPIQYPKLSRQMKKKPLPAPRTQLFDGLGSGHPSTDESIYARDRGFRATFTIKSFMQFHHTAKLTIALAWAKAY